MKLWIFAFAMLATFFLASCSSEMNILWSVK